MKKLKKILITIVSIILFLVVFNFIGDHLYFGTDSTKEINPNWIEIKRKKYPLRHWNYSGIFPAGHFIEDPHISSMGLTWPLIQPFEFDEEVKKALSDKRARYQAYDVNVSFGKPYHETLLAIEANGKVFEYRIEAEDIEGGFVNNFDKVLPSFLKDNKIVFLSSFNLIKPKSDSIYDIIKPRFFFIDLPLKNNQTIKAITPESEEGQKIISYLRKTKCYKNFKRDLCETSRSNIMIKFYEQFESCGK